jgi:hypothetical protein
MDERVLDAVLNAVMIGAGATALLDLYGVARARLSGAAMPDYGPVGRWLLYMPRGQFVHAAIAKSASLTGERVIGWTAHYVIGIAFAGVLLAVWPDFAQTPTLLPALIVGIGSVAAPFLLMQPGMGAGLFASRTPNPRAAQLRSLTTHTVFGLGLYLAGLAAGWVVSLIEF